MQSISHIVSVAYTGEDLATVAQACHLSESEVIQLHQSSQYTVAMIGFKPHFPFLHGLDSKLFLPRRKTPRTQIRAGAVAIAAGQAGIYPCDTPGGWHILGYCDPAVCLSIKPGDMLYFEEIDAGLDKLL